MTSQVTYCWQPSSTPEELHPLLTELGSEYPIRRGETRGTRLCFLADGDGVEVRRACDRVVIRYGGKLHLAARGIGMALAGQAGRGELPFESFGVMYDCSREAVPTVEYLHHWLRRLALFGCNLLMLYTEETYQLPGEPAFGYMRGGYSADEIRAVDACAARLGVELVPCIQTLGHLAQFLKWPSSRTVRDTDSVLLADEPATGELIERMIRFWSENVRSRRIHIGMDEAHDLGRGRFMDKHGAENSFAIFNRHLAKVEAICEAHGMKPMIWSDMYFRMGNPDSLYYDRNTVIPPEVRAAIPQHTELVYWDYYHDDVAFYREWIERHRRDLGKDPLAASGAWCWSRFWYDHAKTAATAGPFLEAAREAKLRCFLMTLWGNDGASCNFESTLAGIAWCADLAYGGSGAKEEVAPLYHAATGGDYRLILKAGELQFDTHEPLTNSGNTCLAVWDDPLFGMAFREFERQNPEFPAKIAEGMERLAGELAPHRAERCGGDFDYAWRTADLIARKFRMYAAMRCAMKEDDRQKLEQIRREIPAMRTALEGMFEAFRRQWLRGHKPFGMEDCEMRIYGQIGRYRELEMRLQEYLAGERGSIPELGEITPPAAAHCWYPQMTLSAGIGR